MKVRLYEGVDFGSLRDALGNAVPCVPSEGTGELVVIDLAPEANLEHAHIYVCIQFPKGPGNWTYSHGVHGWPPGLDDPEAED